MAGLAQLLQSKGRGNDTMLAHITPKEAALLKARGGSGTINPDTGLPEFFDEYSLPSYETPISEPAAPSFTPTTDFLNQGYQAPALEIQPTAAPSYQDFGSFSPAPTTPSPGITPSGAAPAPNLPQAPSSLVPTTTEQPSFLDKLGTAAGKGYDKLSNADLLKLGLGIAQGGIGAVKSRQAQKEAERLRQELQSQAAPYYQKGQEYIQRGQTGDLLPAQQQAIEAQRAQAAQARTRAGVSTTSTMAQQQEAQIQRQVDLFRQQLIDYGFQLTGVGDQITQNAIKAGYSSNKDAQAIANQFYMNAMQSVAGSPSLNQPTARP